ncbi:tripartite tricarboxylate transporter substrate binding protein [Ideonella azotifigens]|uniref:Tripartite tricarboxylate transporter substrate binding protein n=1 Tax=Ideonella azotifigens TaxID=513160 RepID=A0ABN1JSN2_9BURK|nr:tripartite tricarboxylate transporter substrate binding protein [Ideonella azotifigens]MCD2340918.1 tripartite tricarboxylate transporter substrate binding protein [Ideonella azotifigens]
MNRRIAFCLALLAACGAGPALAVDYPNHPVELVVPYNPGGGTDALARAFAEAARRHFPQPIVVYNRPGASGVIGWQEVLNSKPDGYKLALMTVELTTLPHLGLQKFSHEEFTPIARMNADPAAITVKADAPWNTIEEFIAAAKKPGTELQVGNSGNGSIWHLAAAALEDRIGAKFSHIPYQGANPAVLSLLGGHIDAVSVSPAEVATYVAAGKLRMLAVMADQRQKGFEKVPTLKERGIDVAVGTWRGLGLPKNTPKEVVEILKVATQKTMQEPAMREAMEKLSLGYAYGDDETFRAVMARDNETFKALIPKLGLKN